MPLSLVLAALVVAAGVSVYVLPRDSRVPPAVSGGLVSLSISSSPTATSPPVVQTNPATGVTGTSASLNGRLTSLGSASGVSIGFLWGTDPSLAGAMNRSRGSTGFPVAFTYGVLGLTPATTYYFEAWALGDGFTTGAVLSFTTGPAQPPSVTTAAASQVSASAATLNGNLGSLGTASEVPVGFLWGTSPSLAAATNVSAGTMIDVGSFGYTLAGLTPVTTYYFEAWASGQGSALGSILHFTTSTLPPSVTSLAAARITPVSATLRGNLTDLGTATTVRVGFLWGISPTLSAATNTTGVAEPAATTFSDSLSGLTTATTYFFRAWANGDGFSEGFIRNFTTSTTYPQVATDPANAVTPTAASLNGHTTNLGVASIVTVGFLWSASSDLSGATNVTVGPESVTGTFTYAVASLTPATTYYFEAWAVGNGFARGAIYNFTTTNAGTSAGTFLGLPAWEGYLVVAVAAIIAAIPVVLMALKHRKPPRENAPPPRDP